MTTPETAEQFAVRVKAARLYMKVSGQLQQSAPDWIVALVEEGERREREQREAPAPSSG
jgi:hypothetical protein